MIKLEFTPSFKRDIKRLRKKHININEYEKVFILLQTQDIKTLTRVYKDHVLTGNWQGYRDLHITKDLLIIYKIKEAEHVITLVRTGSHDDIF